MPCIHTLLQCIVDLSYHGYTSPTRKGVVQMWRDTCIAAHTERYQPLFTQKVCWVTVSILSTWWMMCSYGCRIHLLSRLYKNFFHPEHEGVLWTAQAVTLYRNSCLPKQRRAGAGNSFHTLVQLAKFVLSAHSTGCPFYAAPAWEPAPLQPFCLLCFLCHLFIIYLVHLHLYYFDCKLCACCEYEFKKLGVKTLRTVFNTYWMSAHLMKHCSVVHRMSPAVDPLEFDAMFCHIWEGFFFFISLPL